MQKENLHLPFEIAYCSIDECPKREHKHSFFELVFVVSGTGWQCINNNTFKYSANHMFLLTPDDSHSFQVETTSTLFFLRFNDIYIQSNALQADNIQRLEYILQNASHQPGCILKNQSDKSLVRPVVEAIMREYEQRDLYNAELVKQLVNTLIVVVARNIARYMPQHISASTEEKAVDILSYIQNNIYFPEKIRTEMLSRHFNVSETYLGRYFKKHTNETMQQYITRYRTRLVEARLQHSSLRLNEIASELGFSDEGHLNKFFKKQKGVSPGKYRKSLVMSA